MSSNDSKFMFGVDVSEDKCTYPKCKCPFDIGEDGKCFIGLQSKAERSERLKHEAEEYVNELYSNGKNK